MSTFNDLVSVVRREVISESAGDGGFADSDILALLYNASAEVAAHLAFPIVSNSTISWSEGDSFFAAPADMVWPRALIVNDRKVELARPEKVLRKGYLKASRYPRFFAFDPRRGGDVLFAPKALVNQTAGSAVIEYVKAISTSELSAGSEVWDGLFGDFHWLVPLRAGASAWDSVGENERAGYFNDKFNQGLQVFATRLGMSHMGNLALPSEARNDKGGRLG